MLKADQETKDGIKNIYFMNMLWVTTKERLTYGEQSRSEGKKQQGN